jgi:hypothetical protein
MIGCKNALPKATRSRVLLVAFGTLLFVGCATVPGWHGNDDQLLYRYPTDFIKPGPGQVGFGLAPLYPRSPDVSYANAMDMATRGLSWTYPLHVKGERLFERGVDGAIAFRGQEVKLSEAVKVEAAACSFDSVAINRSAWVRAGLRPGAGAGSIVFANMIPERPPWLRELPSRPGEVIVVGISNLAHGDEGGSWEVATYNAIVDIAFSLFSSDQLLTKATMGDHVRLTKVATDVVVENFRVLERWRDAEAVYVLAAAQNK